MSASEAGELPISDRNLHQYKTTYRPSSLLPDVRIVVGGITFKEHSAILCSWSQYFDSGLKEMPTRTFEFPDKDPEEWEMIMAMTAPLPNMDITEENVYTALEWFDTLGSEVGLNECDKVVCSDILPGLLTYLFWLLPDVEGSKKILTTDAVEVSQLRTKLDQVLNVLATGLKYRLDSTKARSFEIIQSLLENCPALFEVEQLTKVVSFLRHYEESRSPLWGVLQDHLPPCLSKEKGDLDGILENSLLPALLLSEILRKDGLTRMVALEREEVKAIAEKESKRRKEKAELIACINSMAGKIDDLLDRDSIRAAIINDNVCKYARRLYGGRW